ncbi:MGMT family protein [Pseudomonas juntendi]|uniref:MGMT family protein n=2 Tax=Pseudomonas TaxID=286 RepID=A0A7W2KEK1_9PSED|nr:MGMT family protein [Pseudomonas juntendi]
MLAMVPYGTVTSYGQLAKSMGKLTLPEPSVNPISIIVPCHRVIAANGKLSGYSGGLDKKRDLLPLEAEHTRVDLLQAAFS